MSNVTHCKLIEDMRNEAETQEKIIAINCLSFGTISKEDIAKATELPLEKVEELAAQLNSVTA